MLNSLKYLRYGLLTLPLLLPAEAHAFGLDTLGNWLVGGFDKLIAAGLSFVAMLILTAATVEIYVSLFLVDFTLAIGLFFGPFMLGMAVTQFFRGWVSSWASFMFGAMASKVVLFALVAVFFPLLTQIQTIGATQFQTNPGSAFTNTFAMLAIILLSFVMFMMVKDAKGLAGGLFGFGAGSSGQASDFIKKEIKAKRMPSGGGGGGGGGGNSGQSKSRGA